MIELTDVVLLLLVAKVAGGIIGKYNVSPVVAEIMTGICLGPFILGMVSPSTEFDALAELGLLMMMLYVGLTSKFSDMKRHKVSASVIGVLGVVVSFALGFAVCYSFGFGMAQSLFLGILLSNTSIEVVSGIVIRENTHGTGPIIIAAALADDIIAIYLIGLLSSITSTTLPSVAEIAIITVKIVAFLIVIFYISEKVIVKDIFKLLRLKYFRNDYQMLTIMFILAFSFAIFAKLVGLHEVIGAYMAGLIIGRIRERKDPMLNVQICLNENINHLEVYLKSIFMPLFFISVGLKLNPVSEISWFFIIAVALAAFAGKIIGCGVGARLTRFSADKSLLIGLGMCGRGSLELAIVTYGYSSGIIGKDIFSTIVLVSLFTIILTPLLFRVGIYNINRKERVLK